VSDIGGASFMFLQLFCLEAKVVSLVKSSAAWSFFLFFCRKGFIRRWGGLEMVLDFTVASCCWPRGQR
jgi:hypothetical protein